MTERLLRQGRQVVVWNRTPEKAEPLLSRGAVWSDCPVAECETTLIVLYDSAAVRETLAKWRGSSVRGDVDRPAPRAIPLKRKSWPRRMQELVGGVSRMSGLRVRALKARAGELLGHGRRRSGNLHTLSGLARSALPEPSFNRPPRRGEPDEAGHQPGARVESLSPGGGPGLCQALRLRRTTDARRAQTKRRLQPRDGR